MIVLYHKGVKPANKSVFLERQYVLYYNKSEQFYTFMKEIRMLHIAIIDDDELMQSFLETKVP